MPLELISREELAEYGASLSEYDYRIMATVVRGAVAQLKVGDDHREIARQIILHPDMVGRYIAQQVVADKKLAAHEVVIAYTLLWRSLDFDEKSYFEEHLRPCEYNTTVAIQILEPTDTAIDVNNPPTWLEYLFGDSVTLETIDSKETKSSMGSYTLFASQWCEVQVGGEAKAVMLIETVSGECSSIDLYCCGKDYLSIMSRAVHAADRMPEHLIQVRDLVADYSIKERSDLKAFESKRSKAIPSDIKEATVKSESTRVSYDGLTLFAGRVWDDGTLTAYCSYVAEKFTSKGKRNAASDESAKKWYKSHVKSKDAARWVSVYCDNVKPEKDDPVHEAWQLAFPRG